jgi:hypothetical protein
VLYWKISVMEIFKFPKELAHMCVRFCMVWQHNSSTQEYIRLINLSDYWLPFSVGSLITQLTLHMPSGVAAGMTTIVVR